MYMARMQWLDIAVGEYVGDGQADGDDDDEPVDPVEMYLMPMRRKLMTMLMVLVLF